MIIREATVTDSKWILHHRIEMFKDMGESEESLIETTKLTKRYLEDDWTKDYLYFLVEDDSKVVGGCGISTFRIPPQLSQPKGTYAYLSNMFIEPEYQRKGLGKMLIDYIVEFCKVEKIGLLFLHASDKGLPLYQFLGFVSSERLMHLRTSDYPE
ncbi:MAG: GNAT family N-acetyltransferase [Candidatus Thorarchaeota archaeon]